VARRGKLGVRPHDNLKVSSCPKALYFDVVRLMNGRTNMSRFDVVVTHRAGRCSRQQPPRGATSSTPESPNEEQYRSILEDCKGKLGEAVMNHVGSSLCDVSAQSGYVHQSSTVESSDFSTRSMFHRSHTPLFRFYTPAISRLDVSFCYTLPVQHTFASGPFMRL
jgi:hypothetical protein